MQHRQDTHSMHYLSCPGPAMSCLPRENASSMSERALLFCHAMNRGHGPVGLPACAAEVAARLTNYEHGLSSSSSSSRQARVY